MELNTLAQDFSIAGSDGNIHKLSDYRGKKVILYFYPKDNTPGCTNEACDFRDNYQQISDYNAIVLGISRDSLASHDKFITKLGLPFILLSDENQEVCNIYDVIKEKNMYGKKSLGIERSTFIIDENGILVKEFRKVKVKDHISEVLEILKNM
ncbi:peroxiredoxin [Clostridium folliculivorans]|uniref:thioredoxin-dependent peroxiredoxin n=1 Tax=Clostridium folliculivorans TaxID=2886038 RepID=A0A9W5Y5R2_9CLOT|nr:peroxiredoxin [Clostridium folliculivorans]GKU26937.1 peroxiredoxin [Clostridium folliculivorans]GKU31588.1 peroxiredoxin [Clostridium folliculivorans]